MYQTLPFALSESIRFPASTCVNGRAVSLGEWMLTSDSGTETASVTVEPIVRGALGAAGKNACIL